MKKEIWFWSASNKWKFEFQGMMQDCEIVLYSFPQNTLLSFNPASSNAEKASADNTSAHCNIENYTFRVH